jgi:adenylosuccinate synthase
MTYVKEYKELWQKEINPLDGYFDPMCKIITPYDMLVDHMTEDFIAIENGEREYGSCGFGSWCATHRFKHYPAGIMYMSTALLNKEYYLACMKEIWNNCLGILNRRGIELDKLNKYKEFLNFESIKNKTLLEHFYNDINFFLIHNKLVTFDILWKNTNDFVFEMGQGLGLDHSVGIWHTTSNTGLQNPYALLKNKDDYNAEVCYVTRSYLTRHGKGPLEENVHKDEINSAMEYKTNVHNNFQGSLRYGYLEKLEQEARIENDWARINNDKHFTKSTVITHCNEFSSGFDDSKYYSDDKYSVKMRN